MAGGRHSRRSSVDSELSCAQCSNHFIYIHLHRSRDQRTDQQNGQICDSVRLAVHDSKSDYIYAVLDPNRNQRRNVLVCDIYFEIRLF